MDDRRQPGEVAIHLGGNSDVSDAVPTVSRPDAANVSEAGQADLVRRAQRGDRGAFGVLYERHVGLVHGLLLANGESEEVDDLMQDVFFTAMDRLATLRDPNAFAGWLCAIARNAARMARRRRVRLVPLGDDAAAAAAGGEPDMDGATVLAAIRSLPDAYRETLILRLVEGMSGSEIAARTGLTAGSVRVNLHRGMAMLRERLGGGAA